VIRFQHIVARTALVLLLLAIAVALAAGIGTRLALWSAAVGQFRIFPFSLYAAVAALVAGLVWATAAFASGAGAGARYGVSAILASLIIFWIPARDFWMAEVVHSTPPLNDVSTDTDAPEFVVRDGIARDDIQARYHGLRRISFGGRSYTEEALQRVYYADIKPQGRLGTTANKLYSKALSAAANMGWTIVAAVPDGRGGRIQASDTTLLFGLKDDIIIRIKPAGIGARLDIRSRSRESIPDLGRNAARIRAYIQRLASS
jgi:hypothetical protein